MRDRGAGRGYGAATAAHSGNKDRAQAGCGDRRRSRGPEAQDVVCIALCP